MKNDVKTALIAIGTFVTGIGAGVLATRDYFKKKYEAIADQEIQEMANYYGVKESYLGVDLGTDEEVNPVEDDEVSLIPVGNRNYSEMYKRKNPVPETNESYMSNDNVIEENEETEERSEEHYEWHKKNMKRDPKIISLEDAEELPNFIDWNTLFFYTEDAILTEENGEIIDEPHHMLGECLEKYDFPDNEEDVMYVLNYSHDTVYEITKVRGGFYEGDEF